MKKLLLAACAAVAATTPALAGDLPLQRPYGPQAYNSLFNWTGFYAGVNGGYGWSKAAGTSPDGFVGGVQAGYNYQFSPTGVLGVETDIAATSMSDTAAGAKFGVNYLGTIRGRAGYTMDRVMFYVTGGAAYGQGELDIGGLSNTQTHWGWALGGGLEAMVTPNVSARLEYLYADLGKQTYQSLLGPTNVGFSTNMIRGGLNYHF
ncbi:MAG TPA: outer membrane protein [Xanthobacteraceae bacterium]|nr:outer membrane protein [Xanthobacteraceae bacterium]